jgi:hypothetical protein
VKLVTLCLLVAGTVPAVAAPALFPKPLHLVRRVEDPFVKKAIVVDQYCAGDRVVTVSGNHVTIVDYAQQQMTEIDRAASTYSITRFDEIARAAVAPAAAAKSAAAPKVTPLGMKSSASGRSADSFEIDGGKLKIVAGFDRTVALSRDAVEVLIGSAYPGVKRPEHDALLGVAVTPHNGGRIAANAAAAPAEYGLPIEQTITVRNEDNTSTVTRSSIVRFDNDPPPPALLVIPAESKRVDSRLSRFSQEMQDADTIPIAPRRP